jgi:outer membrane protein OmpA-like peptidoglycan-associated protein
MIRGKWIIMGCAMLMVMTGCATNTHFGVSDKALTVPADFDQTETAIAAAEKSEGAKYCPDKIARAKEKGKYATDIYWTCRTKEAMDTLAEARKLAKEAESCKPPVKAAPESAPTKPAPVKESYSLHSVYFDFNKYDLTPTAKAELDRAAKIMMDHPELNLELQGNTDAIGNSAYNKALGDKRAKAVLDYLKAKGVSSSRMGTVTLGKESPAATNATGSGRAQNRRVDLVIR